MTSYKPDARSQSRGNSGIYLVNQYEIQILDSFGLDGVNNECAGIYTKAAPKVNMCLPPLVCKTNDVEFTTALPEDGKRTKNPFITPKHTAVVTHDNQKTTARPAAHRTD